jgi:hypothetical protein
MRHARLSVALPLIGIKLPRLKMPARPNRTSIGPQSDLNRTWTHPEFDIVL